MKKTLFLALLSIPLLFTACAKVTAAIGTVVATAYQAVVAAPSSVAGKTIVFNYINATEKLEDVDGSVKTIKGVCDAVPAIPSITFGAGNTYYEKFSQPQDYYGCRKEAKYTKINNSTAKIHFDSEVNEFDYVLTFTSPNSGVATRSWSGGDTIAEATGIIFTIK